MAANILDMRATLSLFYSQSAVPVARGVRTTLDRRTKRALSEVSEMRKVKRKAHRLRRGASDEAALSRSLEMLGRINEIDDVKELL